MAVVGSAEIVVRAITSKVRDDIQKAFSDARPVAASAGRQAGSDYTSQFKGALNGANFGDAVEKSLNSGNIGGLGSNHGSEYSGNFMSSVGNGIDMDAVFSGFNFGAIGRDSGTDMGDGIMDGVSGVGPRIEAALGDAGGRGGRAFTAGFESAGFPEAARAAADQFVMLTTAGNALGAGLTILAGGLSSVVSGLFAMGAAASQAVGALGVLPGLAAAAAQGMGALKLGFSGVGEALKAGLAPAPAATTAAANAANTAARAVAAAQGRVQDAYRNAARSIEAAEQRVVDAQRTSARAVKDAKDALKSAYSDAARAAADAADRVASAESDVADAQRDVLSAQRDLTQARKDGAESLQQLAFSAEGAALSEERAGMRLQDAQQKLVAASSLPPDNRNRQEAELAFKEAELNYREAKDKASDLKKEQASAAKAGVDGTKEVLTARERIVDAQKREADAEQRLADAREKQDRTRVDNAEKIRAAQERVDQAQQDGARRVAAARRALGQAEADAARNIADAQQGVTDALARQKEATEKAAATVDKFKASMAKLSPQAQSFVNYLISIQGELRKLKTAAGEEMFPLLEKALRPIVDKLFPIFEGQIRVTGRIIGQMAVAVSKAVTSVEGLNLIRSIMGRNNDILKIGAKAFGDVTIVVLRLLDAVGPLTVRFAKFIGGLADSANKATDTKDEMEGLVGWFNKAGDVAAQLGRIFGNIAKAIFHLGQIAAPAGQGLLDSFERATGGLVTLIDTAKNNGDFAGFFERASTNLRIVGNLISGVALEFLKLGGDPRVAKAFDVLRGAEPYIASIFEAIKRTAVPFANLVVGITRFFAAFTAGDAVTSLFNTLALVANSIANVFENDVVQAILTVAAPVLGILHAFRLLRIAGVAFRLIIIGALSPFGSMLGILGKMPGAFGRAGKAAQNAFNVSATKGATGKAAKAAGVAGDAGAGAAGGATDAFSRNLNELSGQFGRTGAAKDRFILNLKELALQFGKTGAAAGLAPAAAAGAGKNAVKAAAPAAALATAAPAAAAPRAAAAATAAAVAVPVVPKINNAAVTAEITKTGGLVGKLAGLFTGFGRIGSFALAGLGRAFSLLTGPIGLIASIAIPLLITGFQKLYGQNAGFKGFIDGVIAGFSNFVNIIVTTVLPVFAAISMWITGTVIPAFQRFGAQVMTMIQPLITALQPFVAYFSGTLLPIIVSVLSTVGNFITTYFLPIVSIVLVGAFRVLAAVIGAAFRSIAQVVLFAISVIVTVFTKVLIPLITKVIIPLIKTLVSFWRFQFNLIRAITLAVINAIRAFVNNILLPTITLMKIAFTTARAIVNAQIQAIKDKFNAFVTAIRVIWNVVGAAVMARIRSDVAFAKRIANAAFEAMRAAFSIAIRGLKAIWDKTGAPLIRGIGRVFETLSATVTKVWDNIKNAPAAGLRNLINNLNNWLVTPLNVLTKLFGLTVPKIPMPKGLADGGLVTGKGGPRDDKELRRLSPGEFVLREKATSAIGRSTAEYINRTGQLPPQPLVFAPRGGILDKIGDIKDGLLDKIKNGKEKITDLLAKGAGFAIDKLMGGFKNFLPKGNDLIAKLLRNIFDEFRNKAKSWGDKKQEEADRRAADGGGGGPSSGGKSGARGVWNALISGGVDKIHAAGIMGSIQAESGFSPTVMQIGGHSKNPRDAKQGGYGLVQWTPGAKAARVLAGRSPTIANEIWGLLRQLRGKGSDQETRAGRAFFKTNTITDAARVFHLAYERSASKNSAARIRAAHHWYNVFKNANTPDPDGGGGGGTVPVKGGTRKKTRWKGGTFTTKFVAHMQEAERISGVKIHVTQGGFRPRTSYSGTSHAGDALDTRVSNALIRALRKVGIAAGHRTPAMGFAHHVHAIPGPSAGYAGGSAKSFQWKDYLRRGGRKQSLTSPWGLAEGGTVFARPGGIFANIGEGGKNERVEPLDSSGLSARDRAIIELLSGSASNQGNMDVRVFIGDREISDIVRVEVAASQQKLAQDINVGTKRRYRTG